MTRILDRYIVKELGPPFAIGVGVFTFFLVIDRIYQLTDLVITTWTARSARATWATGGGSARPTSASTT